VNATYIFLIWELIDRAPVDDVPPKVRRIMRVRSIVTLCLFGVAAVAKISSGWTRNLLLLPDRLSEARRTGSGESNISFAFEVTEFKCQQMPSRDFVTFAAACNEAYVIFGGCAEAVAMSPFVLWHVCIIGARRKGDRCSREAEIWASSLALTKGRDFP